MIHKFHFRSFTQKKWQSDSNRYLCIQITENYASQLYRGNHHGARDSWMHKQHVVWEGVSVRQTSPSSMRSKSALCCRSPENTVLTEVSQSHGGRYFKIRVMWNAQRNQIHRNRKSGLVVSILGWNQTGGNR